MRRSLPLLRLSDRQRAELTDLRDHAVKPYLRECAAALLKLSAGATIQDVAERGLLRRRDRHTIAAWLNRYLAGGIPALTVRPGRGRALAFPPQEADADRAKTRLRHLLTRDPHTLGFDQTRWTLARIGPACPWLAHHSVSGIWRVLAAFDLHWKRARSYVHRPDPDYDAKLAAIATCRERAAHSGGREIALYPDEMTIERQPTVAAGYAAAGSAQPLARRSYRANTRTRVTATLDPQDGRVVPMRRSIINVRALVAFYPDLVAAYPHAERIWLIQDNWPVHTHPDVLVALEPQTTSFPFHRPASWPTEPHHWAVDQYGNLHLPIQIVPLPTYASSSNPIEKLWRKLRQDHLHLHPWADDLDTLRQTLDDALATFATGSPDLLRSVGLGDASMAH